MSLIESIIALRNALKEEIPEQKDIIALHELINLAHLRVLTASIEKIKFDTERDFRNKLEKNSETLIQSKYVAEEKTIGKSDLEFNSIDSSMNNGPSNRSINNKYAQLNVGLNDRVAFVKTLFNNSDEDFQMVIAAIATMETKQECEYFIKNTIQPDYEWSNKKETVERFMLFICARFD